MRACISSCYIRGVVPGPIEGLKMAFDGKLQMLYSGSSSSNEIHI